MAISVEQARRLFTADEFERMGTAGVLSEDDRVELIEGEIVEMAPIGPGHAGSVNRLNRLLVDLLGDRAVIAVQNPVRLDVRSEPQPDLTVARPRADFYEGAHPRPDDVLWLVEVAETSLAFDTRVKAPLYARAGIGELWIVDVSAGRVETHRQPASGVYEAVSTLGRGDRLTPQAFADVSVEVADLLGAL